jgi:sulfite exporter TauE/SafE
MPKVYQSLESEKYLLEALKKDKNFARQQARKSASQAFTNILIIALAVAAGYFAIKSMPAWLPVVETTFHQWTNYKYV